MATSGWMGVAQVRDGMPPGSSARADVAVVGAGISGLTAAHRLQRAGLTVAVLEAGDQPGGKVRSGMLAGVPIELGPDGFLARGGTVAGLCRELGLVGRLVEPAVSRAAVWSRGRPRELPQGLAMGVPSRPLALAMSGILSPLGALRAGLDLVLPAHPVGEMTTVAEAVESRFGREARERLIDPLIGGIYAGDTTRLGLAATLPDLYSAMAGNRSLLLALRRRKPAPGPAFQSLAGGLQQMTDALAGELADLRLRTEVASLRPLPGGGFAIEGAESEIRAGAVILATPAYVSAELLGSVDPRANELLAAIPYASVATIALAYQRSAVPRTGTSGFLVPALEGRFVTALTWASEKWPQAGPDPVAIVRCSVGRVGDDRWRKLDDAALTDVVIGDVAALAGLRATPLAAKVTRWQSALPQYQPGHASRIAEVEARLAEYPGLVLAGAAYRGVGLPACIADGERAAAAAAEPLASRR
jgi:protoporphyrinogen/coproporphyrinogen III oxidase